VAGRKVKIHRTIKEMIFALERKFKNERDIVDILIYSLLALSLLVA
jgi:hypothetical protein